MALPPPEQGFRRYLYDQGGQTEAIDLLPYQYEEGIELPPQLSGLTLWSEDGMDQFEAPRAPWGSGYMPMQEELPTVGSNYMFDLFGGDTPQVMDGWTGPAVSGLPGTAFTAPQNRLYGEGLPVGSLDAFLDALDQSLFDQTASPVEAGQPNMDELIESIRRVKNRIPPDGILVERESGIPNVGFAGPEAGPPPALPF
jgi:hypothetical protein